MKRWQRVFGSTEGSEIAEMAMVLPVMFLVFLGIFWVGRSYNIYATVNQAAREGARVAAQSTCGSCSDTPGSDAAVLAAVSASLQADFLDPVNIKNPNPDPTTTAISCAGGAVTCTKPGNMFVCRNVQLTPNNVSPQECGVLVEFTYPIDLTPIPVMSVLGNVQIAARAQMRTEQ
jgi:Flp pilus assembly protein TadG